MKYYTLRIPSQARKFVKSLPERYRKSAVNSLADLKINPYLGKPLKKELVGYHSYQFGPYRIVYKIKKSDRVVEVFRIRHRSKSYN